MAIIPYYIYIFCRLSIPFSVKLQKCDFSFNATQRCHPQPLTLNWRSKSLLLRWKSCETSEQDYWHNAKPKKQQAPLSWVGWLGGDFFFVKHQNGVELLGPNTGGPTKKQQKTTVRLIYLWGMGTKEMYLEISERSSKCYNYFGMVSPPSHGKRRFRMIFKNSKNPGGRCSWVGEAAPRYIQDIP